MSETACADYEAILDGEDDFGFEAEQPKRRPATPLEIVGRRFEEINRFVDVVGAEPVPDLPFSTTRIVEKVLATRLALFRTDPRFARMVSEFDRHGLLAGVPLVDDAGTPGAVEEAPEREWTYDEILELDPYGLLDDAEGDSIFVLRHVVDPRSRPEHVAERRPCRDFPLFEPAFERCRRELASGILKAVPFASEQAVAEGDFFVLNGLLVHVAERSAEQVRTARRRHDARVRCIVENGTEYEPLARSLARSLYKDEHGRRIVVAGSAADPSSRTAGRTGSVYVLRSLSKDRGIAAMRDLRKIGYTDGPVEERIAGASSQPTYLMADVRVEGVFPLPGMSAEVFESLVHRFFGEVRLDMDVRLPDGTHYRPREWFLLPLDVVRRAVAMMADGSIVGHRYDMASRTIVPLLPARVREEAAVV